MSAPTSTSSSTSTCNTVGGATTARLTGIELLTIWLHGSAKTRSSSLKLTEILSLPWADSMKCPTIPTSPTLHQTATVRSPPSFRGVREIMTSSRNGCLRTWRGKWLYQELEFQDLSPKKWLRPWNLKSHTWSSRPISKNNSPLNSSRTLPIFSKRLVRWALSRPRN